MERFRNFYKPPVANSYTFAFLDLEAFTEVLRRGETFYLGNEEIGTFRQLASWMLVNKARYAVPVMNSGYYCWEQVFFESPAAREILKEGNVMYLPKLGLFIQYLAEENLYVTSDGRKLEAVPEGQYCINFMADYQPGNEPAADVCDASANWGGKNRIIYHVDSKCPARRFEYLMFTNDLNWWMTWSSTPSKLLLHNGERLEKELSLEETALYLLEYEGAYKHDIYTLEPAIIDGAQLLEEIRNAPGPHFEIVEIKNHSVFVWYLNRTEALEKFKSAAIGNGKYFINPFTDAARSLYSHN